MSLVKPLRIASLVLIVALFAVPAFGADDSFENSWEWKRVRPNLQQLWLAAKKNGTLDQMVKCSLVVNDGGGQGDESLLFGAGYYVQVFTGNIAKGHMNLQDLPQVVGVGFVRTIELAK